MSEQDSGNLYYYYYYYYYYDGQTTGLQKKLDMTRKQNAL